MRSRTEPNASSSSPPSSSRASSASSYSCTTRRISARTYLIYPSEEADKVYRVPQNMEHLRQLNEVISRYATDNLTYVLFAFCYLYVFMQSFAIPGPVFLSILSGQLFGPIPGFCMVCLCATFGASACYGLSYSLARGIVLNRFPSAIVSFNRKVLHTTHHPDQRQQ